MRRQAIFISLCLLFAVATSSFGFVHALLGGCDDIEKDFKFEKTLREKCNKELEEANQRAADADDVKRQLGDCQNDVKKLKNDIEKLKKEKDYAKGEATDYENMLIREQTECRKKDKRCKAGEEQLQQTQNKLTECEDKLIDCGGTQSVQAKKHVEFLKGQINDLKKLRDRLESELEDTQTSFRNLRYTETICQSNYSDLVQQLSEYKSRIQSLQNENQACQKGGGAGGTGQFYFDNLIITAFVGVAYTLIIYVVLNRVNSDHTNTLKQRLKDRDTELHHVKDLLESEKRHSSEINRVKETASTEPQERQNIDLQNERPPAYSRKSNKGGPSSPVEKLRETRSADLPKGTSPFFSDEDEDDPDPQNHRVKKQKGEGETSVNGETEPAKDEAEPQGEQHGSHHQSKTVPKEGTGADQTRSSEKTAAERREEESEKSKDQENQVHSEKSADDTTSNPDDTTEIQHTGDVPEPIDKPTTTTTAAGGANPQDKPPSPTSEKTKKRSIKKRLFGNKNGKGKNK